MNNPHTKVTPFVATLHKEVTNRDGTKFTIEIADPNPPALNR